MRWNNPLNTTQPWAGASDQNSVGVKSYANVQDGVNATVVTMQNGRYPNIIRNLQQSLPASQWWNASSDLRTWGSGTNWLPGAGSVSSAVPTLPANYLGPQVPQPAQPSGPCVTNWSIFGANLCMDGIVGGFAMAAGGALLLTGALVMIAFTFKGTAASRGASHTLEAMSGPVGLVKSAQSSFKQRAVQRQVSAQQAQTQAQQVREQTHREATQRAQLRQQRAKARLFEAQARTAKGGQPT